jgi:hypothetical protein
MEMTYALSAICSVIPSSMVKSLKFRRLFANFNCLKRFNDPLIRLSSGTSVSCSGGVAVPHKTFTVYSKRKNIEQSYLSYAFFALVC